jgi:voltage-gated potassium channel
LTENINKLKNQTIICGYGRSGKQAYQTLTEHGVSCVVVEKDKAICSGNFGANFKHEKRLNLKA